MGIEGNRVDESSVLRSVDEFGYFRPWLAQRPSDRYVNDFFHRGFSGGAILVAPRDRERLEFGASIRRGFVAFVACGDPARLFVDETLLARRIVECIKCSAQMASH